MATTTVCRCCWASCGSGIPITTSRGVQSQRLPRRCGPKPTGRVGEHRVGHPRAVQWPLT